MPLAAAVHLGQDIEANLRHVTNNLWNSVKQILSETGKLISGQTEITGANTIDFTELTWMSLSLLNSRALSALQRQSLRLLRLCTPCGENGR